MTDEQRELMRIAAQRLLDDHSAGRNTNPEGIAWAKWTVSQIKPLGRPLGPGVPAVKGRGLESSSVAALDASSRRLPGGRNSSRQENISG